MNFQTEAQQDCYQKVADWLPEICDRVNPITSSPLFSLQLGSATVLIEIRPFRELEAVIYLWAYVATEVEVSYDLLLYLLKQNDNFRFGGFSMADEGDIRFHVSLLGASCQENEFKLALAEVLETADRYDDLIVERWGGRRAADALFEV
ncbi:T3SS (YopN, CesT) and YbjN peptide-binding chaperone 1 [Pseudanabaena sp. UWO310]|uniref:T3SS (YopN, CesT) and YbjN peptide-binding chaperone 1 n=1 Tax=Pseudanabaena sp. UWO310 TaxID=2480795 RepID=UPI001680B5DE|nr:YbjN domain-containing protein [Pseudanabaena sp. UWO310]